MVTEYRKENVEQNNVQLEFSTERLSSAPRTKHSTKFMFHMYGNACRHKVENLFHCENRVKVTRLCMQGFTQILMKFTIVNCFIFKRIRLMKIDFITRLTDLVTFENP